MAKPTTLFIGLDSHKDFISVAHAEAASTDPPVFVKGIGTRQADIDKLVRRLHSKASHLVFAYEAGPSGYGLYRYLTGKGEECRVVAPSLIPKRFGVTAYRLRRSSAPAPARPTRLGVWCRRTRLSPVEKHIGVEVTTTLGDPHHLPVLSHPLRGVKKRVCLLTRSPLLVVRRSAGPATLDSVEFGLVGHKTFDIRERA